MISGSYDPGEIWLFRGLKKPLKKSVRKTAIAYFDAGETICDEAGIPLVHHPKEYRQYQQVDEVKKFGTSETLLRIASFGSWPAVADWDHDGDLDILIGTFEGEVFLRRNIGTAKFPKFSRDAFRVYANRKPLKVKMHASPVVADWDGDGFQDLIVGSGDGAVGWFRNIGGDKQPQLEDYRALVLPASNSKHFNQFLADGHTPTHGTRAQISVVDYNGDGMLDLLIGDYSEVNWLKKLNESELAELNRLTKQMERITVEAESDGQKYKEDWQNEEYQRLRRNRIKEYQAAETDRSKFIKKSQRSSFVWLFLRTSHKGRSDWPTKARTGTPELSDAAQRIGNSKTEQLRLTAFVTRSKDKPRQYEITALLSIKPGWHLYEHVAADQGIKPTRLSFELPRGVQLVDDCTYPKGLEKSGGKERIWFGETRLTQILLIDEKVIDDKVMEPNLVIKVDFQICNERMCLPPGQLTHKIKLRSPQ